MKIPQEEWDKLGNDDKILVNTSRILENQKGLLLFNFSFTLLIISFLFLFTGFILSSIFLDREFVYIGLKWYFIFSVSAIIFVIIPNISQIKNNKIIFNKYFSITKKTNKEK